MKEIILASASPRRKEILEQLGIPYKVHPAVGEEKAESTVPFEIVQELAKGKAREVSAYYTDGIFLAADTVVACDGDIMGKPQNRAHAREMLIRLQGRIHEVYTGVCILKLENGAVQSEICFAEETKVHIGSMSEWEIQTYTASGECDDKAGAYGIQGSFAAYIQKIEGDYYNVVGLPAYRVYQSLKDWLY